MSHIDFHESFAREDERKSEWAVSDDTALARTQPFSCSGSAAPDRSHSEPRTLQRQLSAPARRAVRCQQTPRGGEGGVCNWTLVRALSHLFALSGVRVSQHERASLQTLVFFCLRGGTVCKRERPRVLCI